MGQAFANARDDSRNWSRQPYGVTLGDNFKDYRAELISQMSYLMSAQEGKPDKASAESIVAGNEVEGAKNQYAAPTVSDSSIFGNDVINPYAGFCRDDDIVHTSYTKPGSEHVYGMGRVYAEVYDSKQQVVYFQFGIPKYRNLRRYLMNAADGDMADLNDNGEPGVVAKLGSLIKKGAVLAIKLPWLPLEWGFKAIDGLDSTKVTEYFYFKETMMLYWRHVNTILCHLSVSMGLFGEGDTSNLPSILQGGPDIFKILRIRSERYDAVETPPTDDLLKNSLKQNAPTDEDKGIWETVKDWVSNLWGTTISGVKTTALDSSRFLAFRLEKGSDNASETFSNSTQESSLQQRLNGLVAQSRQRNLSDEMNGNDALSWVKRKAAQASSLLEKTKSLFTDPSNLGAAVSSVIDYMAAGNGYFDLPQQWCGSNFSRSASISIRLRAKTGGDPVSVFTEIMIPLACLIAAAIPRASGDCTYTSPFIMRCWCRGMFAIPAGIIQSLSISRGDSEFGWTLTRLPTTISVNMSITDLSPIMFLGLAGEGAWAQAFANNTKLHEYLNTLAGLGLKQRYYQFQQLKRNAKVWALIHKNTTLSSTYWGMRLGDTSFARIVSAFAPLRVMRTGNN